MKSDELYYSETSQSALLNEMVAELEKSTEVTLKKHDISCVERQGSPVTSCSLHFSDDVDISVVMSHKSSNNSRGGFKVDVKHRDRRGEWTVFRAFPQRMVRDADYRLISTPLKPAQIARSVIKAVLEERAKKEQKLAREQASLAEEQAKKREWAENEARVAALQLPEVTGMWASSPRPGEVFVHYDSSKLTPEQASKVGQAIHAALQDKRFDNPVAKSDEK